EPSLLDGHLGRCGVALRRRVQIVDVACLIWRAVKRQRALLEADREVMLARARRDHLDPAVLVFLSVTGRDHVDLRLAEVHAFTVIRLVSGPGWAGGCLWRRRRVGRHAFVPLATRPGRCDLRRRW